MNLYSERYASKNILFPAFSPPPELDLIIVIPCFNEPEVEKALLSLNACVSTDKMMVILVVNESDSEDKSVCKQNELSIDSASKLSLNYELLISHVTLPKKKAGVGLARKIGMDEAVRLFEQIDKNGIIVCLDADCYCASNYIEAIQAFYQKSKQECGVVHYEHDLSLNTRAIIDYEIHLRYYIDGLRWAGFTNAYQTLGSCITVKSKRYQKEGGMNTRKAGEDFYFLHKIIPNGHFGEINTTTVHPSARISERVPFGTGHAVGKYVNVPDYQTYNPLIFIELKAFIIQLNKIYFREYFSFSKEMNQYFESIQFNENTERIRKESANFDDFQKRFFRWFDGFKTFKIVHYLRDSKYPNVSISSAIDWMDKELQISDFAKKTSRQDILVDLRNNDRSYWDD